MEVGVDSLGSENGARLAMEFPVVDGTKLTSPPRLPARLRRRLTETKASLSSVEEIETKLRDADVRRQKFYENLSSKARSKPRNPPQSSPEENLGQRLEAKLRVAEQNRLSIMAKAQLRLAKLDELRQAARTGVELRVKKECAELCTKVESRVRQAETNRMHILKAYRQRRASLTERASQSLLRRITRESKYKERVRAAIFQKRAAAEKKRLGLLEADKRKAHFRLLQVEKAAKSVSQQREIERRRLRESLEDRLQRAKRQRAEFLMQRSRLHNSVGGPWNRKMQKEAELLSRKLARCWRKFLKQRTTFNLAKAYKALDINEIHVKSIPFEHLALLIESVSTLQTTKAFLDRLESRYRLSLSATSTTNHRGEDDLHHLLKRVVSPRKAAHKRQVKSSPIREEARTPVLSRYQVRVVLCAYMIVGHPDAVFSGRGEREIALAKSAEKFVCEFELLIKIILDGPQENPAEECDPTLPRRCTFKYQLAVFDSAWCSYLNSFVVWKVKDAESLEEDLVRAACQLEVSMMQKCKLTSEGDSGALTHDMKAIQKQVTEDQELLQEKVMHLSGDAGLERMQNALSDTRMKFFEARENGSPVGSPIAHILSTSPPKSPPLSSVSAEDKKCPVVRTLFRNDSSSPSTKKIGFSAPTSHRSENKINDFGLKFQMENEVIVNEYVHGKHHSFTDTFEEDQTTVMVRETIEKAFWDGVIESLRQEGPDYGRVVQLLKEVRDELCDIAPQSWRQEIMQAIDLDILSQLLNSSNLDMDYLGKILEFALASLQKLSAAANENKLKEAHQKVLTELAEICQAGDGSKLSNAMALIKGLHFVLEQIQTLKQEISKARIRLMEPLLKGPAGLDYLAKAFAKRNGPPSDAVSSLPLTMSWLSSVWPNKDQEWDEHSMAFSELNGQENLPQRLLPPQTLRTGGNLSVKMNRFSVASTSTETIDDEFPECKGEKVDLAVRLGLVKLVTEVHGVTQEELPETLKHSFLRLRAVQAQVQKITVIATSILVLRQILLSDRLVVNPEEMLTVISNCAKQISEALDASEDAGIEEIVKILTKATEEHDQSNDGETISSRKTFISRMLAKSLQFGDNVFTRVSLAIHVAVRGVVLGGGGRGGKLMAQKGLQAVGAGVLVDQVVEVGKVLLVVAAVSGVVHGPWYAELIGRLCIEKCN